MKKKLLILSLALGVFSAQSQQSVMHFDGIDDYISVPHSAALDLATTFTIEAWVKYNGSNSTIIDKGNYDYLFQLNPTGSGELGFYNLNSGWKHSTGTVPQDTWTHVAVSVNSGTLTFYINGMPSGTTSINLTQDTGPVNIGRQQPTSCVCNHFDGSMDELRIWNIARTQAQLQAESDNELTGGEPGLVAYYSFNDGVGNADNTAMTTLTDYSVISNTGTFQNFALNGNSSNFIAPTFGTPLLPDVNACSNVEINPAIAANSYNIYQGTSPDPLVYATAGTYIINWTFDDLAGSVVTVPQNITVTDAAGITNFTTTDMNCPGETVDILFEIPGGTSQTAYNLETIASGNLNDASTWASGVINFSSQYGFGWTATSVLGTPDVYPTYADQPGAWASAFEDNQREFITVSCAPVLAGEVRVYETYNPGAIDTVYVREASSGTWFTIYTGTAVPTPPVATISSYPVPFSIGAIDAIRIAVNSPDVPDFNEFDAIEIVPSPAVEITGVSAGSYDLTISDNTGCIGYSTIVITDPAEIITNQNPAICDGDSYSVGVNTYTTAGIYTDLLTSVNGCDSTVNTDLVINPLYSVSQNITLCNGESITVGTSTYTTPATYVDLLVSSAGCDSTVTTVLAVNPTFASAQNLTICNGESINVGGNVHTADGIYTDVLTAMSGCDSTVTTDLTVLPTASSSQNVVLCAGEFVTVGSNTYTADGVYTDIFTAVNGCDSTVTTTVDAIGVINVTTSLAGITVSANSTGATYQWIDCNNANAPVAGATAQDFTPVADGNYAVVVSYSSCSDTSACITVAGVGIKNNDHNNAVSVYPNPSQGLYTLTIYQPAQIIVMNAIGETLFSKTASAGEISIDLSDRANGIYFVKVVSDNHQQTLKLIKQ